MKKLILLAVFLTAGLFHAQGKTNAEVIIAVNDFTISVNGMPEVYGKNMSSILRSKLVQSNAVNVVERKQIVELLDKLKILPSQLQDPNTAIKVGKMLQSNYMILGEVSELFGDTLIATRLINIESGRIVSEYDVKYDHTQDIVQAIKSMAEKVITQVGIVSLTFENPKNGETFPMGKLTASGKHSLSANAHVWLLLSDGKLYYLQNARLSLSSNGTWTNSGINLGHGITELCAVLVNNEGNEAFLGRVRNNRWGGFSVLPPGSSILDSVNIRVKE